MTGKRQLIAARRIKERREKLGYTQADLAGMIGKTQKQIWIYENAKGLPSVEGLIELAEVLYVTPDWLLGFDEFESDQEERYLLALYRSKSPESKAKLVEIAKVV